MTASQISRLRQAYEAISTTKDRRTHARGVAVLAELLDELETEDLHRRFKFGALMPMREELR